MTNQRQSWKWDAEAAFKRDEIRLSLSEARAWDKDHEHDYLPLTEGSLNQLPTKHRKGWTPAPTKPAYSQTNVNLEHKGRDYEALTKAALRKPVGYWEDAPRGMEFGGGGEKARLANAPVPVSQMSHAAAPSAPTTPPPAAKKPPVGYYEDVPHGIKFGGQPLLSASTKPHGKDVDTADGPWPKWVKWPSGRLTRFDSNTSGKTWYTSGGCYPFSAGDYASSGERDGMDLTQSEALQWLEQNGHADVAAQLRGKPINSLSIPTKLIGGPERDAIVAECRKAMGI